MVRRAPVVSKAIVEALSNPAALSGTELRIQLRRDEATNWGAENPVLFEGELGVDTTSKNLKLGDGSSAWNDLPFLSVKPSDVSSAIAAALAAYTPTSSLAAVATSGSASDLVTGTLANARLSAQVVRSDFSYPDPAWITAIASSKLTGTIADARLGSNVPLKNASNVFSALNTFADVVATGTLQIGGAAGHLLRWNAGAAALEVRDSGNSWYRKTRLGELQIIADTGGNFVTPANARMGFLTQIGGYIAGAISGRTYSGSAIYGDIVISASPAIGTGQNDYSGLTDDLAVRGNTGNVEINRGLLGVGMAPQTWRSITVLPVNTGDRSGVRINDYGSFASAVNQSAFEVAYLGGTPTAPSSPVAGQYRNLLVFRTGGTNGLLSSSPGFAIRSTIGAVIGSSLSMVDTSFVVTPTGTGVPIFAQTIYGNTGLTDFPQGQLQLGTNVRLKNSGGNLHVRNSGDSGFSSLEAFNGTFNNYVTSVQGIFSGAGGVAHLNGAVGVGSAVWLDYTANSNVLYRRDATNGRMHATYTQGATAALALTQFHSRVTVDDRLVVSSPQTGNTLQATFTNTTANEPAGFRMNNGSWDIGFRTNPVGSGWFEITSGGSGAIQHRWTGVDYLLASSAKIYFSGGGSSISGVGVASQDVGIGRASNGTIRIYNSAGNDGSLQAANGAFSGTLTSAFQSLSSDPSTLDIASGLSRLVKNTTSGEIAKFVNDGGVIKKAGSTVPGITNLDGLSDVTVTSPAEGQVIRHNGTEFANHTPTSTTQIYDTPGTTAWIKPAGATRVTVVCIGGGGGGGSGRRGPPGEASVGGGGGVAGSVGMRVYNASILPSTVDVTITAGGTGATGRTTDDTNGANGGHGGSASFGDVGSPIRLLAGGGAWGSGGAAGSGGGSGGGTTANIIAPFAGEAASTSGGAANRAGVPAPAPMGFMIAGGAAGGGVSAANASSRGGHHTDQGVQAGWFGIGASTGGGAAGGGNGSDGPATIVETISHLGAMLGLGGGGGGSNTAGPGGNGGNALGYGCGGGGGGASRNGFASGAGGNGGKAAVFIITEF
jgi:hypothetical protein